MQAARHGYNMGGELMESQPQNEATLAESVRQTRPLYWVLIAAMGFLYYWALKSVPALSETTHLITFTTLMLVHALLHLAGANIARRHQWLIPYFVAQGALIFTIVYMAPGGGFIYGLYWAMAGEAAMILADLRAASLTIVCYMALSAVNFGLSIGWDQIPSLIAYIAPMTFFILVYALMFQRQAKARQQSQSLLADLEAAHRQLAEYAVQVESLTLTAERERMARELHDTLAQGLAGLILQLEAVDTHLSRNQVERAQTITAQAMSRARATLAEARHAIDDLRDTEAVIDVEAAVRAEAERFASATGIACDLDLEITSHIPEPIAEHVLKIVSEGLTNIARHARAEHANLQIEAHNGSLEMKIHDDGAGFDINQIGKSGHYGLIGMRERTRLAGGTLDVLSQPGEGTTLRLRFPLKEKNGTK
ncbi:MAG TPA: sensor histidine kinase [Anaerolineae bacterium]|nr:sensor histidine kinase [Anaerolineae bacterium]